MEPQELIVEAEEFDGLLYLLESQTEDDYEVTSYTFPINAAS